MVTGWLIERSLESIVLGYNLEYQKVTTYPNIFLLDKLKSNYFFNK